MLENKFRSARWWRFKTLLRLISLSLSATFLLPVPLAFAAAPVISTTWTIANGAESPPVFLDGTGFASDNDKFDFTVDMGTTGLEYDSVAFVDSSHMRFNFHGIAKTGTITIQANASAFLPLANEASNTISIVVPVPLIPQSIAFTQPLSMTVKDKDQTPITSSTSGLSVVLTSNTPSVCTIDFLKIHAVAAGTCSITANVNGNLIYSQAIPVTRSFIVLASAVTSPPNPPAPVEEVTNLGSLSYDPNNTSGGYVSVLVASESADPKEATLVKLLIPPKATDIPVVFLISAYSTDAESKAGYFAVRTKMIDSNGSAVSTIKADIEINIPSGSKEGIPSWSFDGRSWYKLQRIESEVLPPDVHAGYFVERDGRIAIFTDYLMLFGFRKLQTPLKISAPALSIETNSGVQLTYKGGSGEGQIKFFTRTNEFCTVTPAGVVTGVKTGKCIVAANKEASGIYAQAASSAISIFIQESSAQPSHSSKDPNHLLLCQELSYTLQTNSTLVFVNLCEEDKGELATLEVGTKSPNGTLRYTVVGRQLLDGNGVSLFKLAKALKAGQVLRVKAEGKVQITTVIGSK